MNVYGTTESVARRAQAEVQSAYATYLSAMTDAYTNETSRRPGQIDRYSRRNAEAALAAIDVLCYVLTGCGRLRHVPFFYGYAVAEVAA